MKILRYLFAYCVIGSTIASCASGPPSYEQNIQSAISGRGWVNVRFIEPNVVLLTGRVEDAYTLQAVKRAASNHDDVQQVISRIFVMN